MIKYIAPLILLGGCTVLIPEKSRTAMVGMPVTDVLACAGKPTDSLEISPDDWILQYNQDQDVSSAKTFTYSGLFTFNMGSTGRCHAIFRIHKNYLVSVHFSGPSLTLEGPDGACIPLIKECVSRQDHTTLPEHYNLKTYLEGKNG